MTYHPSHVPHGQPLGYTPQNRRPQPAQSHNTWPSPHTNSPQQFHPDQYQNNSNYGVAYAHQVPQHLPPAQNPAQVHHGVPIQNVQLVQQPQTAYQFQGYDPSTDQRPYVQPLPQNNMHMAPQMMPPTRPPQTLNPYAQQQQQHHHHQPQRMDWQSIPPAVSVASPSLPSYATIQPQPQLQPPLQPQLQRQIQRQPQHGQPQFQPQPQSQPRLQPQSQPHPQSQPQHQHQPQYQHQPQPQPPQYQPQPQHHRPQQINTPAASHPPQLQQQHINSPIMPQTPRVLPPHAISSQQRNASAGARIEPTAKVSASPRLLPQNVTRSPSVSSTRSPALAPALIPHHQDTASLLICMADEFLAKARRGVRDVAASLDNQSVHDYQKLIATGLSCLEVAIGSNKLPPRVEALARLQYASVLCAETNNIMEAEMALTKGITLCERNRFTDLKYCIQFQQIQLLFSQHKEKAALIAVDARIRDAEVVKHTHWVYVFRFLKTSFYLQSSNPTEVHALENLKAITTLASQRGDSPIFAVASLLEGLSHLRAMKEDSIVRIQACIAQASKYQLEDSMSIIQIDVLQLVLDLACSLQQKSPHMITQKLQALQDKMDYSIRDTSWSFQDRQIHLPIRKQAVNQHIISTDTSSIIRPGGDNEPCDYLAISLWSKLEAFTTTYTYSGLALMYQQHRNDKKLFSLWEEALSQLQKNRGKIRGWAQCLEDAVQYINWERETTCYLHILRGLHLATSTKWDEVKNCVTRLESLAAPTSGTTVVLYSMYLAGVYYQGTGDLEAAIKIYSHPNFSLNADAVRGDHRHPFGSEAALLATFNLIWIMQNPKYRNDQRTQELLEQVRPLCADHPNMEIRTAYNLVMAAIQTNPPVPMTAVKTHISTALSNAKNLADVHTLSIALNLMRAKLFQSIIGDQALKSAKAASAQARRSGNILWMSVADGMLSQSYEVQGAIPEAQKVWQDAMFFANKALKTSEE